MHINEKNRTPKVVEADEGPSKSELKRQMTERQKLAEVLAALSSDALKTIPMDEAIKVAIAETNKIKSFERDFIEFLELKHRDVLDSLRDGILNNDITAVLEKVASEIVMKYKPQ